MTELYLYIDSVSVRVKKRGYSNGDTALKEWLNS
jgi:hypothetical protein